MARVEDVAEFFIEYYNDNDELITNLMLNKLLYFAQGHCLAETGKPLFDDIFEAWKYGPVIPKIYNKYKVCGRKTPLVPEEGVLCSKNLTPDTMDLLAGVAQHYMGISGYGMTQLTHQQGTPWQLVYDENVKYQPISNNSIASYFNGTTLDEFDDEELDEDEIQALKDYEEAKKNGTLVTYTLEELRSQYDMAC